MKKPIAALAALLIPLMFASPATGSTEVCPDGAVMDSGTCVQVGTVDATPAPGLTTVCPDGTMLDAAGACVTPARAVKCRTGWHRAVVKSCKNKGKGGWVLRPTPPSA